MNPDPPETSELQAFVAIVEAGSVSGAARELGLPRATVSRRLGRLEERLSTVLLRRTSRQLRLTEAGAELYRHAREILASVENATRSLLQDDAEPRGLLRVSVPQIIDPRFHAMVIEFLTAHPAVRFELVSTSRHQDLIADNIDVAWRAGASLSPGLIARTMARTRLVAVAAPAYLSAHGAPESVEDLGDHQCLVGFTNGERPATHWALLDGGQVRVRHALASNDLLLLVRACVAGRGIGYLPVQVVDDLLADGSLVPVLPGVLGTEGRIALVYAERRLMRPAVRAFIDHCAAWWDREPRPFRVARDG